MRYVWCILNPSRQKVIGWYARQNKLKYWPPKWELTKWELTKWELIKWELILPLPRLHPALWPHYDKLGQWFDKVEDPFWSHIHGWYARQNKLKYWPPIARLRTQSFLETEGRYRPVWFKNLEPGSLSAGKQFHLQGRLGWDHRC